VKKNSFLAQKSLIQVVEKGNEIVVEYINYIHKIKFCTLKKERHAHKKKSYKKKGMLQTLKHRNKPNAINKWFKK
jgi:hypothetical protein